MEEDLLKRIKQRLNQYKQHSEKQYLNCLKWIERLITHAINEKETKSKSARYWTYPRGSIIKVDFGFNVGYEIGGVHYAVVLNNNDSIYSGTLNVVPLSSKKEKKKLSMYEVDLGSEFYDNIQHKLGATQRTLNMYYIYREPLARELTDFKAKYGTEKCLFDEKMSQTYPTIWLQLVSAKNIEIDIDYLTREHQERENFHYKEMESNKHLLKELAYMKEGTVAKIDQFRMISKNRIVSPTKSYHALNKVKLFDETMERINQKTKQMFMFDK